MSENDESGEGFNESELQDIMSEIENLEGEFATDSKASNLDDLAITTAETTELQKSIDEEVEDLIDSGSDELIEESSNVEDELEELNSLGDSLEKNIETSTTPVTPIHKAPEPSGSDASSLNFNMNFKIGGSDVYLDFNDGLHLLVGGIEVKIDEGEGCSVQLPGGIKFSVPLEGVSKKKAA